MEIPKATAQEEDQVMALLRQLPPSDQLTSDFWAIGDTYRRVVENPELGSIVVVGGEGGIIGVVSLSYRMAIRCGGSYSCVEEFIVGGQLLRAARISYALPRPAISMLIVHYLAKGVPFETTFLYN